MNLTDRLLGPNADLAQLMGELLLHLPETAVGDDVVDPAMWDQALIGPARDILSRSGKGFRARLLEHCYQAAGNTADDPPEVLSVLIELLHVGSLVIDDIEDDSPMRRGGPALHRRYGVPIALNTGNWFYFLPLVLLSNADLDASLRLAIYEDISVALFRCHQGQALDLAIQTGTVPQHALPALVGRSTRLKTGALMELAAVIGARTARETGNGVAPYARFGAELGVGLQMLDDWSGIRMEKRRHKGREDIRLGRLTWPWAWMAQCCDQVTYAGMMRKLQRTSSDGDADSIIKQLRSELSATAPLRIRTHMEQTLRSLRDGVGPSANLKTLCEDVERLEKAFG